MDKGLRPILVLGAGGMLGSAVVRRTPPSLKVLGADRSEADITDEASVAALLAATNPSWIINCAAYTNVDGCESNAEQAFTVNGEAPGIIAGQAAKIGAGLIHISTDYVFDGYATIPYGEKSPVAPISVYGKSKLAGEKAIADSGLVNSIIVRTSWLYGTGGKNFVDTMARLSLKMKSLKVVADQMGRPTYAEDLADALFMLLECESGTYHYSNGGQTSWHGLAEAVVGEMRRIGAKVETGEVLPILTSEYPRAATPPAYSVMSTAKFTLATGREPPDWQDALRRYFDSYGSQYLQVSEGQL